MKRPALVSLVIALLTVAAPGGGGPAQAAELRLGTWTVGAGLGFLRDTPDDTAFALNLNADYVMDPRFSIGPLLQLGFTGDMSQIGLSGQAKYWLPLPDTGQRFKLAIQGGLGFIYSSFRDDDTSWLIPLGVGVDYAIDDKLSATGTFILNLTDLDTGRGSDANVMPGVTFGVRF